MNAETQGKRAADTFRQNHQLGLQPLGDLVSLIEKTTGYDVAVVDAPQNEHGLTMRDKTRGVIFIAVATTPHPMRQRSTLAHELAHTIFQDWEDSDDPQFLSFRESRADTFARHLLIPEQGLQEFVGQDVTITEKILSDVVHYFAVSPAIATIALANLGLINTQQKTAWMRTTTPRLATKFGWIDHYQQMQSDSQQQRAPQRLLGRAIAGYEEGVVSLQTIATLRGVPPTQISEEFQAAGITPRDLDDPVLAAEDLPIVPADLTFFDDDKPPATKL